MAYEWELHIYFDKSHDRGDELEEETYFGRPVYKAEVIVDGYEHGQTGSLAMYYSDEEGETMERSFSLKDPDVIGVEAYRHGEPDEPEIEPESESDEWEQDAN